MDWNSLWTMLQAAGLPGVVLGFLVLVFVYLGEFTGVFNTGFLKRASAVVSSYLFAGTLPGNEYTAIVAAITLVVSTFFHWLLEKLTSELEERRPKPK